MQDPDSSSVLSPWTHTAVQGTLFQCRILSDGLVCSRGRGHKLDYRCLLTTSAVKSLKHKICSEGLDSIRCSDGVYADTAYTAPVPVAEMLAVRYIVSTHSEIEVADNETDVAIGASVARAVRNCFRSWTTSCLSPAVGRSVLQYPLLWHQVSASESMV